MEIEDWMVFVDGENLTARAESVCSERDENPNEEYFYRDGVYFWGNTNGNYIESYSRVRSTVGNSAAGLTFNPIRAKFYATCGSGNGVDERVARELKSKGFTPEVFPVSSSEDQTFDRLDVQLATDLVGNAYRDNYTAAVLVGGDGDYVPAVQEAQRQGKVIFLAAFDHPKGGISEELRLQCDYFIDLCSTLLK